MEQQKNKIQNVIIHIGVPKTASTSIQETLFTNTIALKYADKYYYPKCWSSNHGRVLGKLFADDLNHRTSPLKISINRTPEQYKIDLCNELRNRSFDTLVLSAEILVLASEKTLICLKHFIYEVCNSNQVNISIVGYVRNPVHAFNSLFQELTKHPWYATYTERFLCGDLQLSIQSLQSFINVFGKENIKLFKFENAVCHRYGPVGFFYDNCLEVELEDIAAIKIKRKNEGMSQIAMDLCLFINSQAPMYNKERTIRSSHRQLGCLLFDDLTMIYKHISGTNFKLSKQDRYSHLEKYKEQHLNKLFDIEYSLEDMRLEIERDTEPCHVPTEKNLEEINRIFYYLDHVIQDCVIAYLNGISSLLNEDDGLNVRLQNLISILKRKKVNLTNKLIMTCRKKIYSFRVKRLNDLMK